MMAIPIGFKFPQGDTHRYGLTKQSLVDINSGWEKVPTPHTRDFSCRRIKICPLQSGKSRVRPVMSNGDITMIHETYTASTRSIGIGSSPHKLTAREHEVMT